MDELEATLEPTTTEQSLDQTEASPEPLGGQQEAEQQTEGQSVEEAGEARTFSLDAFETAIKKEQLKPTEEAKETATEEGEEGKVPPSKVAAQPPKLTPDGKPARDYSGLSEREAFLARKMGNETFSYFVPKFKQSRQQITELKEEVSSLKAAAKASPDQLPSSYYEHPQAFILSKGYGEAVRDYNGAQLELNHWKQQLMRIRAGQEWQDLSQDDKGGYQALAPRAATAEDEVNVLQWMQNAGSIMNRAGQSIQELQSAHKNQHTQIIEKVRSREKELFPQYEAKDNPSSKTIEAVLAVARKDGFGDNILTPLMAKLYTYCVEQHQEIKRLQATTQKKQALALDAKRAQPTASNFDGASGKGAKMLDLAAFGFDGP